MAGGPGERPLPRGATVESRAAKRTHKTTATLFCGLGDSLRTADREILRSKSETFSGSFCATPGGVPASRQNPRGEG